LLPSLFAFIFINQPAKAQAGTISIMPDGSINPSTANITTHDNVTYTFTGNINDEITVERDDIVVDGAGYTLQGPGTESGIILSGRTNITIEYMEIKAFHEGVDLLNSSNIKVFGNNIIDSENGTGILLYGSSNNSISENNLRLSIHAIPEPVSTGIMIFLSSNYNTISQNTIENAFEGIAIQDSSSNNVAGNTVRKNYYGIGVVDSNYNNISENIVTSGKFGIDLERCSNNILSRNNMTENNNDGITLYPQASSNVVYKNYIVDNFRGIILWEASSNSIYSNNFVNNSQQVYIIASGYNNSWDDGYPSGGNYWSDYNGTDFYSGPYQNVSGSVGIGDTAYVINSENRDNYPLVPPEQMRDLMIQKYIGLISAYQSLNSTYVDLQSKQEATISELNYITNLAYIFMATTIILIATTIYLITRKPRAKLGSKTTPIDAAILDAKTS
jgi:parallel beta-helix repeat protein